MLQHRLRVSRSAGQCPPLPLHVTGKPCHLRCLRCRRPDNLSCPHVHTGCSRQPASLPPLTDPRACLGRRCSASSQTPARLPCPLQQGGPAAPCQPVRPPLPAEPAPPLPVLHRGGLTGRSWRRASSTGRAMQGEQAARCRSPGRGHHKAQLRPLRPVLLRSLHSGGTSSTGTSAGTGPSLGQHGWQVREDGQ